MFLDCDWSISVQVILNRSAKTVKTAQNSVTRVQKSVTNTSTAIGTLKTQQKFK